MEIVKKYWREMVFVICLLVIFFLIRHGQTLSQQNSLLLHRADSSYLVAKYYRNRDGELVGQVNVLELTVKDLKKLGESVGSDNYKLKKQVGNLNNLVGFWKGQASSKGSDTVRFSDTVYLDSKGLEVKAQKLDWTNKFLSIKGLYNSVDKKFTFDYVYDLGGFELTAYRKRAGFLKSKQLVTDIKFGDPSMRVTSFQGLVIKEPKKKIWETRGFAFGVGALFGIWVMK